MKKISAGIVLVLLCISVFAIPVCAASTEQDGLKAELFTDKSEYQDGEAIGATLVVTNTGEKTVSNVSLRTVLPEGYTLSEDSKLTDTIQSLAPGESVTIKSTFVKAAENSGSSDASETPSSESSASSGKDTIQNVDTGDQTNVVWWVFLAGISAFAVVFTLVFKKKAQKRFLSLLLILPMVGSCMLCLPSNANAASIQKSMELTESVKVGTKEVALTAYVQYDAPQENEDGPDPGGEVTREEWIVALSELFDLPEAADGQHSFDDYADAANAQKIEAAIRKGFVPLTPDGDNMVYFKPQEPTTREFAAYTAVHALEYQIDPTQAPEWADAADLTYPAEALLAVNTELLQIKENKFFPKAALTPAQMDHALQAVQKILDRASVSGSGEGTVNYVDQVQETELIYELDESNKTIYIVEPEKIAGWKSGEVHVLHSADGTQKDIAVRVVEIRSEGSETVLVYEEPALKEVATSFDVFGKTESKGTFTPAEGVTIEDETQTRASTSGEIALFGKKKLSLNIGDVSFSGSIDIQNLEYRFAASPSWHLITIDEVYLALNTALEFNVQYMNDFDTDVKKKIGSFKVPVGYGFNAAGDINLIFKAGGGVEVGFEITQKAGIQYAKNHGIRPVYDVDVNPLSLAFKGEIKGGLALEVGAEFLGIDLISVGAEGGLAFEGQVENLSVAPIAFCLDGTGYVFLGIYAQIGWDDLNLKYDREILNSDHSVWKKQMHFEETGMVADCTRGNGDYQGYVKRADNDVPIHNAKVQVIRNNEIKDTTYSDSHGFFKGIKLKKGSYTIRVSAAGYRPYEQTFQIVGGQTTSLETQLMIANEEDIQGNQLTCSGMITNAYTGGAVADAAITVRSKFLFGDGEIVAQVTSQEDGSFQFYAPIGYYEVTVQKEGFSENKRAVVLMGDKSDFYISLSPENQPSVEGNLRAVLHWGSTPLDLDSHMVGPGQNGTFHVFYQNMSDENVTLDVDDTTSYGPETISISETNPGVYSYYIHDYSNRFSDSSTALSESGAYIELYVDNTLLYTIHVPANQGGTVWHVFDYDTQTDSIQLVNEFSYQSDPRMIGNRSEQAEYSSSLTLKAYEMEAQDPQSAQNPAA